jgi:predicted DNA-binding transcriptional regulator AlpA
VTTASDNERISISVPAAARIIGISDQHAYDLSREGKLPGAYRMGRRVLVHVPTLKVELERMATRIQRP